MAKATDIISLDHFKDAIRLPRDDDELNRLITGHITGALKELGDRACLAILDRTITLNFLAAIDGARLVPVATLPAPGTISAARWILADLSEVEIAAIDAPPRPLRVDEYGRGTYAFRPAAGQWGGWQEGAASLRLDLAVGLPAAAVPSSVVEAAIMLARGFVDGEPLGEDFRILTTQIVNTIKA